MTEELKARIAKLTPYQQEQIRLDITFHGEGFISYKVAYYENENKMNAVPVRHVLTNPDGSYDWRYSW